jgi:DNA polymerase-4
MTASIIHIDMDAFFASVEQRENHSLIGQPVIVGGSAERRGVVAAASYEVRQFGVHSAMPTKTALNLCPHAVVIKPRLAFYAEISQQLREIFFRYTPLVEPLSLDEAFLDVSGCKSLFGSAEVIGRRIKQEIKDELDLVASVGVASNKYLAKLASYVEKPDGFCIINEEKIQSFLEPLPVKRIWGVGAATEKKLTALGIHTIKQLKSLTEESLLRLFGKVGTQMWHLARGLDERGVVPDSRAKSISNEQTFVEDIADIGVLREHLRELVDQVSQRLRSAGLHAKTVNLKVRYHDFKTFTRSKTLSLPNDATEVFYETVIEMLENRLPDRELRLRLIGMGVSGLGSGVRQQELFDQADRQQREKLDEVSDLIRDRFGDDALRRGKTE